MLTVIITTDDSDSFLHEYSTLFLPFQQEGQIAFCHWNPAGKDYKSALPELSGLVAAQTEWRALVALIQREDDLDQEQEFPAELDNPFDFCCNGRQDGYEVEESNIPLIRLAQMLGGVPEPIYEFADDLVQQPETGRWMRDTVLKTTRESIRQQRIKWSVLEDKYQFSGPKPCAVWFLVSRPYPASRVRKKNQEQDSPEPKKDLSFAQRNRYPARARFFTMDCMGSRYGRGTLEEFRFWMAALTLAINDYDGGRVEPEKLYQIHLDLSTEQWRKLLSDYCNRLSRIRRMMERRASALRTRAHQEEPPKEQELPDFTFKVTVAMDPVNSSELQVEDGDLGLSRDCPEDELDWWGRSVRQSGRAMEKLLMAPRRALDQACLYAHRNSSVAPIQVRKLDLYQQEELEHLLMEEEIALFQTNADEALPLGRIRRDRRKADRQVRETIGGRMSRRMTTIAGVAALLLYLAGFVPEWIRARMQGAELGPILLACAIRLGILAVVGLLTLLWFRHGLRRKVGDYNAVMRTLGTKINAMCEFYSGYLTQICTYMRGRGALDLIQSRTVAVQEQTDRMERHIRALDRCCRQTISWMESMGLERMEDEHSGQPEYFNVEIPPEENEAYELRTRRSILKRDRSGRQIRVPYPFVQGLEFEREELFK